MKQLTIPNPTAYSGEVHCYHVRCRKESHENANRFLYQTPWYHRVVLATEPHSGETL